MLTVHVDTDSLTRASSGSITGVLFLRGDGAAFPEEGWSDFPVVVLAWWLEALEGLRSGRAASASCRFMEGPFSVEVARRGVEFLLRGQRDGRRVEVLVEERVDLESFWREVRAGASRVVAVCAARGWTSKDLESLRRWLD
ncbi:hypothetical protein [Vitiosangium sp. GDMCC 1.1324]|uniref:hypothetical protein n=1 Tax=Vitiosangium sp. (strain GDMCC 1.1324) TaxID=2138576 RepID=UPI0011B83151|nr:hypothetical protein [Vitiosangium sp. GDMCC 1.1324]